MGDQADNNSATQAKRHSVAKATGVVGAVTLLSRVLGMLRDMLIAKYFGAGFATDAFFTAFKIPNLLRRLVAEGSLSTAFVPVISDEIAKGREHVSVALRATSGFCLLLTTVLSVLGILFAEPITYVFALGWSDQPEKLQLAAHLLRIMMPYVILISLTALSAGALNALGYYGWAAASPALLNIGIIGVIYFVSQRLEQPIYSLALAILLGGILGLLPQVISLQRLGYSLYPKSPFHSSAVKRLVRLMLPAVVSSSVYQIMVFLNSILVTMLEEGSPSWLYFADRLFQFPLGVFSIAIATAVLPPLSQLASSAQNEAFIKLLSKTLGWVAFITIPASIGLSILSLEIVQVIYQDGEFTAFDSQNTALSLIGFSLGLWSLSTHTVLVRAFMAKKNTKTPAFVAVVSIIANMLFALTLMGPPLERDSNIATQILYSMHTYLPDISLGHIGLALAGSLASFVSVGLLALCLREIEIALPWKYLLLSLCRTLAASLCMLAILYMLRPYAIAHLTPIPRLLSLLVLGVSTYGACSILFRSEELCFMQTIWQERRARRK